MSNKTAMMKLYDMLDEGKISEIAEIKEYFLMLEQKQIEEAWDGGNYGYFYSKGSGKDFNDGSEYYKEVYKENNK